MSTAETPTEAGNGLTRFSLHVADESSAGVLDGLDAERAAAPALRPEGVDTLAAVDPETAARRILDQALASPAVPSLPRRWRTGPPASSRQSGRRPCRSPARPQ